MAVGAIAAIAGGLLGAGGSIGGGILSQPEAVAPGTQPFFNPATDPLTALTRLNALSQFGVFDPTTLQVASPIERAIQQLRAQGVPGSLTGDLTGAKKLRRGQVGIQDAFDTVLKIREEGLKIPDNIFGTKGELKTEKLQRRIQSLGFEPGDTITAEEARQLDAETLIQLANPKVSARGVQQIQDIINSSGLGSLDDLIQAQLDFDASLPGTLAPFEQAAERNRQLKESIDQQLFDLATGGGLDLDTLRRNEEARAAISTEDQRQQLLQAANFGGFNPAGGLERLAELEETNQNTALSRAIGLLTGATSQASLLQGLDPTRAATAVQPALQASSNPFFLGTPSPAQFAPPGGLGAGVANAGAQLGLAGLLAGDIFSNRPTTQNAGLNVGPATNGGSALQGIPQGIGFF